MSLVTIWLQIRDRVSLDTTRFQEKDGDRIADVSLALSIIFVLRLIFLFQHIKVLNDSIVYLKVHKGVCRSENRGNLRVSQEDKRPGCSVCYFHEWWVRYLASRWDY